MLFYLSWRAIEFRTAPLTPWRCGFLFAVVMGWIVPDVVLGEDLYGAIAYSQSSRRYGWATGKESREIAEAAALHECGASDAFIAVQGKNVFLALAHGNGTSYGWGWDGKSEQVARDIATSKCAERAAGCHLLVSVYSGGKAAAKVIVKVPANTDVFIGDYKVPISAGTGQFDTAPLLGGKDYNYSLVGRMTMNGLVVEQKIDTLVKAFHVTEVSFDDLKMKADKMKAKADELKLLAELGEIPEVAPELPAYPLLKP